MGYPFHQIIAVCLPEKAKADYRLMFRFLRTKDLTSGKMLPANFIVGIERLTPENAALLKRVEAGEGIPIEDWPPIKDGFRLRYCGTSGDMEVKGNYLMNPVAKGDTVTLFIGPLEG